MPFFDCSTATWVELTTYGEIQCSREVADYSWPFALIEASTCISRFIATSFRVWCNAALHAFARGCTACNCHLLASRVECTISGPWHNNDRVANVKNQPPDFKQLIPCTWRAHWCLNNRTLKLHPEAYKLTASELHLNCFTWLRG